MVHGVALKPGKPICLAAEHGKPVVILPGFPTSAIFTFHEFVAPVILALAGRVGPRASLTARLAVKINSEIGRHRVRAGWAGRRPHGRRNRRVSDGQGLGLGHRVQPGRRIHRDRPSRRDRRSGRGGSRATLGRELRAADLVIIGSHCIGLDYLLGLLQDRGFHTKFLSVGSTAGLSAVTRNECDLAGIHLLDVRTGQYNHAYITSELSSSPATAGFKASSIARATHDSQGI